MRDRGRKVQRVSERGRRGGGKAAERRKRGRKLGGMPIRGGTRLEEGRKESREAFHQAN